MSDDEGLHDPKVDVSFAPTESFVKKWGTEEAAAQARRYNQPSWQKQTLEEEDLFIPTQIDEESDEINPLLLTDARNVLAEEELRKALLVGCVGGIALAFSIWLLLKFNGRLQGEIQ